MSNAVGRISSICPDLGGCDLLGLLRSVYSTPLLHGHPRQVPGAKGKGMGVNNGVKVDLWVRYSAGVCTAGHHPQSRN